MFEIRHVAQERTGTNRFSAAMLLLAVWFGPSGCADKGEDLAPALPTWARTFSSFDATTLHIDTVREVLQTAGRDYLVMGESLFGGTTTTWVMNLDDKGDVTWHRMVAGYRAVATAWEPSGEILLAGNRFDDQRVHRIRLQAATDQFTGNEYGLDDARLFASAGHFAGDGSTVLLGHAFSPDSGAENYPVVKLAPDGTLAWERGYQRPTGTPVGFGTITGTKDGGLVAGGGYNAWESCTNCAAPLIAVIGSDGDVTWAKYFEDESRRKNDYAGAIRPLSTGGFILIGSTQDDQEDPAEALVMRIDGTGKIRWQKALETGEQTSVSSLTVRPDGGCTLAGLLANAAAGSTQTLWVVSLDGNGSILWQHTYGNEDAYSSPVLARSDDGGYLVGYARRVAGHDVGLGILRLDANGNIDDPTCTVVGNASARAVDTGFAPVAVEFSPVSPPGSTVTAVAGPITQPDYYMQVDCGLGEDWNTTWGGNGVGGSCDCEVGKTCAGPTTGCVLGLMCVGHFSTSGTPIGNCTHRCYTNADCTSGGDCNYLFVNDKFIGMFCY